MSAFVVNFVLNLSLAAVATASDRSYVPIYGGAAVGQGQWPEVIALRAGDLLCTGTIIAPQVVLTAAHCLSNLQKGSAVEIYGGSHVDPGNPEFAGPIATSTVWAPHPAYCGDIECGDSTFDYGYIVLPEPMDLDHYPKPIATQVEWDALMRKGQALWLLGFGETELNTLGEKRIVATTIDTFSAQGLQFHTSGKGKDSCRGDSGGPALVATLDGLEWRLAGVLSSGDIQCGQGGWYGVPVAILDWLAKEAPYHVPAGACNNASCLDTHPAGKKANGCAQTTNESAVSTILAWLVAGYVACGRRGRTCSS